MMAIAAAELIRIAVLINNDANSIEIVSGVFRNTTYALSVF